MSYDVTVAGNITYIGEKRVVGKDKQSVIDFSVAVNHPRRNANGEWDRNNSTTTFQRCTAWGTLAENLEASLSVGNHVLITGTLSTGDDYTNKDGETVTPDPNLRVKEIGASLRFNTVEPAQRAKGGNSQASAGDNKPAAKKRTATKKAAKPAVADDDFSDDLFDDEDSF